LLVCTYQLIFFHLKGITIGIRSFASSSIKKNSAHQGVSLYTPSQPSDEGKTPSLISRFTCLPPHIPFGKRRLASFGKRRLLLPRTNGSILRGRKELYLSGKASWSTRRLISALNYRRGTLLFRRRKKKPIRGSPPFLYHMGSSPKERNHVGSRHEEEKSGRRSIRKGFVGRRQWASWPWLGREGRRGKRRRPRQGKKKEGRNARPCMPEEQHRCRRILLLQQGGKKKEKDS